MLFYFSDQAQDYLLDTFVFRGLRNGTFVDVCPEHDFLGNNTCAFERNRGWTGFYLSDTAPVGRNVKHIPAVTKECLSDVISAAPEIHYLALDGSPGGATEAVGLLAQRRGIIHAVTCGPLCESDRLALLRRLKPGFAYVGTYSGAPFFLHRQSPFYRAWAWQLRLAIRALDLHPHVRTWLTGEDGDDLKNMGRTAA